MRLNTILPVLPMNRVQMRFILYSSVLYRSVRNLVKSAVRRTGKIAYASKTGLPSSSSQAAEVRQSELELASASLPIRRLTSRRFW
jgi:hypothetical protein